MDIIERTLYYSMFHVHDTLQMLFVINCVLLIQLQINCGEKRLPLLLAFL